MIEALPVLMAVGVFAIVLESALYYIAPEWLARGARLRFAEHIVELPPRVQATGYREAGARPWTVSELGLAGVTLRNSRSVGASARDFAWVRLRYRFEFFRVLALVGVRAHVEGDHLHLRARVAVVPQWSLVAMLPLLSFMAIAVSRQASFVIGGGVVCAIFALSLFVSVTIARGRLRPDTIHLLDEMAARARRATGGR